VATEPERCKVFDQISGRDCRYYAGHGGRHNFARLDHDCHLERELRRALDAMTAARDEACDIATRSTDARPPIDRKRIAELRKVGAP
jgi:hypothetical protein